MNEPADPEVRGIEELEAKAQRAIAHSLNGDTKAIRLRLRQKVKKKRKQLAAAVRGIANGDDQEGDEEDGSEETERG